MSVSPGKPPNSGKRVWRRCLVLPQTSGKTFSWLMGNSKPGFAFGVVGLCRFSSGVSPDVSCAGFRSPRVLRVARSSHSSRPQDRRHRVRRSSAPLMLRPSSHQPTRRRLSVGAVAPIATSFWRGCVVPSARLTARITSSLRVATDPLSHRAEASRGLLARNLVDPPAVALSHRPGRETTSAPETLFSVCRPEISSACWSLLRE